MPDTLNREEVLFSWALGEAYSPRWQKDIFAVIPANIIAKLEKGETQAFTKEERNALINELCARRPWFISEYIDKSNHFRIMHFPSRLLGGIAVLPTFGWEKEPVSLSRYLKMDTKEEWKDDPRQVIKKYRSNPPAPPYAGLPIVAYCDELACDILIDGYSRCLTALLNMQQGVALPPIPIIYCERR